MKRSTKFQRPTQEEIAEGYGYTEEEQANIAKTLAALKEAEHELGGQRLAWRTIAYGKRIANAPLLHAENIVRWHRYKVRTQRKVVHRAQQAYWEACEPLRLRMHRAAKLMSSFIMDKLAQESYARKIFKVVKVEKHNTPHLTKPCR